MVAAPVGDRERCLSVCSALSPSEHPLDKTHPGEACGESYVVAGRSHLQALELQGVGAGQAAGPRLHLRELVEGVVEDPWRIRFPSALDHAFEQSTGTLVVLEVEEDGGEVDRNHAARVDAVDQLPGKLERLLDSTGEGLRPREVLPEVERSLGRRIG